MKLSSVIFLVILFKGCDFQYYNSSVDPASAQLVDFAQKHKVPIGILTTSAGKPVDLRETIAINSDLLSSQFFVESIQKLVNARIPRRIVMAKGAGAHGYFEVTHDISKYTKANVFNGVGKKTPVFTRFAVSQINPGGSDLNTFAFRGMSVKFYTEEGNLDLLSVQTPVFPFNDPALFPPMVQSLRPNPKTNIRDWQGIDLITLRPETLGAVLWIASGFGVPKGYRHMNGYTAQTFELYNEHGESHFVKFNFRSELGFETLTLEQITAIDGFDLDISIRDLYNAIECKLYPSWILEMEVLKPHITDVDFNPFDLTRLWPNGTYDTVPIGRLVLNRNVDNYFAEVEQASFLPSNVVPGINFPPDELFKARVLAYPMAQVHRLGSNFNNIEINRPKYAKNYNRNGDPPVLSNMNGAPDYFPNSFNGPIPYIDGAKTQLQLKLLLSNTVDLTQASSFYNTVLATNAQKQRLVNNLAKTFLKAPAKIQQRLIYLFAKVDNDLCERYKQTLRAAMETARYPTLITDITAPYPDPELGII